MAIFKEFLYKLYNCNT